MSMTSLPKFADNTKVGEEALTTTDCQRIIIVERIQWSKKWEISYNLDKYKIMHIRTRNSNGKPRKVMEKELDFQSLSGVTKHSKKNQYNI